MGNLIDTDGLDQYTDEITTFTSGDSSSPSSFTTIPVVASKEKPSSLFQKLSQAISNIRWLYKPTFTRNTTSTSYSIDYKSINPSSGSTISTVFNYLSNMAQNVECLRWNSVLSNSTIFGGGPVQTEAATSWSNWYINTVFTSLGGASTKVVFMGQILVTGLSSGNTLAITIKTKPSSSGTEKIIGYQMSNGATTISVPFFVMYDLGDLSSSGGAKIYYKIYGTSGYSSATYSYTSVFFRFRG